MQRGPAIPDGPPGWYPDPDDSEQLVYFDGNGWTDATVSRQSDSATHLAQATTAPIGSQAPSLAPVRDNSPPAALRPLYLYAAAASAIGRVGGRLAAGPYGVFMAVNTLLVGLTVFYFPTVILPVLAIYLITFFIVSVPRLHDGNYSAAELLWIPGLVLPIIGVYQGFMLARKLFSNGQPHYNRFGPAPR